MNELPTSIEKTLAEHQAKEMRRRQQQGLGRPIISTEFAGHRVVAVGNVVHFSKRWKTFHDFLLDYIQELFDRNWGIKEQKKPLEQRHILMRWNHEIGLQFADHSTGSPQEKVHTMVATPILRAYLGLTYNLYLIRHNAKLQRALIARLKNRDESSFHGALYETFVAAMFIQAGFDIEFENEQDGTSRHCEFVATSKATKNKFSVEAKSRFRGSVSANANPSELKLGVRDKLEAALQKRANHTRVVFIDVNMPGKHSEHDRPFWIDCALKEIREVEITMSSAGQESPQAYVIATNCPYQFDTSGEITALMEGFNIPEWKLGAQFPTLRAAVDARERHYDMHQLFQSMQVNSRVPSTFDAEMPEIHFSQDKGAVTLKIGNHYLVRCGDGIERPAELTDAIVMEEEKSVYGVYRIESGQNFIAKCPISDTELEAYKAYPDTFFGVVRHQPKQRTDLLSMYDFFFETYRHTPKEKLLEFLKEADDIGFLTQLSQTELARTYCERMIYGIERRAQTTDAA